MDAIQMTPAQAKKIVADALKCRGVSYTKLTARTVSFMDLGRGSRLFVKIHGWQPSPVWGDVEIIARNAGFSIE
jgi:hypothetical protein